ncbi:MAG TPA: hypothetical protein VGN07_21870 [Steroidobacteraceae bacterium]|jgi:hypothetical protein
MLRLLQTFFDIAVWRKGPQDLPESRFLASFVLCTYIMISFVYTQLLHLRLRTAVPMIAIDVLMLLGWLWVVLVFFSRRHRFLQTATSLLGVGVLFGGINIVARTVQLATGPAQDLPFFWQALSFYALALMMGRIFMHALDRGLLTGMALTMAIVYSTNAVAQLTLKQMQGL